MPWPQVRIAAFAVALRLPSTAADVIPAAAHSADYSAPLRLLLSLLLLPLSLTLLPLLHP
jgi:hypothetical protein